MSEYENIKKFMSLIHQFHIVERVAEVPTLERRTNGPEHCFQLAMLAWYMVVTQRLPLNVEKILSYALIHDLVEAYAGDTPNFDVEGLKTKAQREHDARARIETEFPELNPLITLLDTYERKEDDESRFVYALDKFIDPLNASMIRDRTSFWKEHNMSYEQHFAYKNPKIALSSDAIPLWEELCEELKRDKDFFFPPDSK